MKNEKNDSHKSNSYFDLYQNSFEKSKPFDNINSKIEQNDSYSK